MKVYFFDTKGICTTKAIGSLSRFTSSNGTKNVTVNAYGGGGIESHPKLGQVIVKQDPSGNQETECGIIAYEDARLTDPVYADWQYLIEALVVAFTNKPTEQVEIFFTNNHDVLAGYSSYSYENVKIESLVAALTVTHPVIVH